VDFASLHIHTLTDLARLPWFRLEEDGKLRLKDDSGVPPVLDVHTHVGWSYGFAQAVDMSQRTGSARHFFNYNTSQDVLFEEAHPYPAEKRLMTKEFGLALVKTGRSSSTHTAANLVEEMERSGYCRAFLLPNEIPVHSRHAEQTLAASRLDTRLTAMAAVHPWRWSQRKIDQLERLFAQGAQGLKFNPVWQGIRPDNRHAMALFEWCAERGVVVLSHCGYCGAEPFFLRYKAIPGHFRAVLESFPKLRLILAHTGMSVYQDALALANAFADQVWLDISIQPVPHIQEILRRHDPAKVLYGSDWPFVPLHVALARTLVATEDCPDYRHDLLHNNAARLFGIADTA